MTRRSGKPPAKPSYRTDGDRLAAVRARDERADGQFYYAVKTTGVYCRPSCKARPARAENIAFYPSPAAAQGAGYRACKRCRPNGPGRDALRSAIVERACRLIAASEEMPSLAQLADGVGVSPFHLHRIFKQATGLTPKAYGDDLRATRAQAALAAGDTVTTAIYTAGYGSSSRFYAAAGEHLGMEPSRYRKGGKGAVIRFAVGRSTLGEILVAATEKGICAIFLGDDAQELISALHQRFANAELIGGDPAFDTLVGKAIAAVEAATAGKSQVASLPLDLQGTAFQIRVWHALQEIPRGMTTTYAALADSIGEPKATRAVASACGANPVAVIVPCHRVVRTDGGLGGYRWGLARKEALLERERGEAD